MSDNKNHHDHEHEHEDHHEHEHAHDHHHEHEHEASQGCCGKGKEDAHDSCCCHSQCDDERDAQDDIEANDGDVIFHVSGMDCASCAATITTAVGRLPGVENVHVSLTRERLSLTLDTQKTKKDIIEKTVSSLGYQLSDASTYQSPKKEDAARWYQTNKGKTALLAGSVLLCAFVLSYFVPAYELLFFAIATIIAIFPIAKHAFVALKNGSPFTIEMLMTIAAIGAIVIQQTEEAAIVVFLFTIGELLEGVAAGRARAGIKALGNLTPKVALLLEASGQREVAADTLKIGDVILARPGDRIAADGVIVDGLSGIDESPVTGESVPIVKQAGDKVYAGSINREAALRIEVETEASDNTIQRIIHMVEEAKDAKAPTERFIDGFAKVYMPIIVGIAIIVAVIPPIFVGDWYGWTYKALTLLLIGCPCALVISVPAAIASGLSAGTRQGLLIKGGNVVETLSKINCITFDKTGTLTAGTPQVTDIVTFGISENEALSLATSIEQESSHPLAQAILQKGKETARKGTAFDKIETIPGKGMVGIQKDERYFVGAPRFAKEFGTLDKKVEDQASILEKAGKTVVVLLKNGVAMALFALRDEPREDAKNAIHALSDMGVSAVMLTGDNSRTAQAIAEEIGMDFRAELLPEDKVDAIVALKREKNVAMVGDGINDAPALAAANVGIAMGSGTDVALETADAAILRNRVTDVPELIRLAKGTMTNIRENVMIALGLKLVFLVTTLLGITGLWLAIMADTGATVLVTINALRLLRFGSKKRQ